MIANQLSSAGGDFCWKYILVQYVYLIQIIAKFIQLFLSTFGLFLRILHSELTLIGVVIKARAFTGMYHLQSPLNISIILYC